MSKPYHDFKVGDHLIDKQRRLEVGVVKKAQKTWVEVYFCHGCNQPHTERYDRGQIKSLERV